MDRLVRERSGCAELHYAMLRSVFLHHANRAPYSETAGLYAQRHEGCTDASARTRCCRVNASTMGG